MNRRHAIVAAALLVGCTQRSPAPLPEQPLERGRQQSLTVATYADVGTLDPATSVDGLSPMVMAHIYAPLVEINESGALVPYLAESYASFDDHTRYVFRLRAGVRFQNGQPFNAQSVIESFERSFGPGANGGNDGAFDHLAGMKEFKEHKAAHIEGLHADGDLQLSIRLARPDTSFLTRLSLPATRPVCPGSAPPGSPEFAPCGAGAYALLPGAWKQGRELTLTRADVGASPYHPALQSIRWLFQTTPNTQRLLFLRGDIDVVSELSYVDDMALRADPAWRALVSYEPSKQAFGEIMDTQSAPFSNRHLRRAVAFAVDRSKFERIKPGSIVGSAFPLPAVVRDEVGELPCQHYDPQAALAEMALAGYPFDPNTGKGGYPYEIPYLVYAQGVPEYSAQVVARELQKIGLRLQIRVVSYNAYLALAQRRGASPISFGGWAMDVPDAVSFMRPLFHSSAIADEDSTNSAFYANPTVDRALDQAARALNADERRSALREAISTVCEDAPWAFSFEQRSSIYVQRYVRGFHVHPLTRYWFLNTSIVQPGAP